MQTLQLSDKMIALVAQRFRVLGEPLRLRILQTLEAGPVSVNQIVAQLQGNQPNISRHLQTLYDAGLVGRRREGASVLYDIADPMVFKLCDLVCRSEADRTRQKLEEFDRQLNVHAQLSRKSA